MKKPNWLEQNPVNWFDLNKFDDGLNLLLSKDKTLQYNDGELFVILHKERMIIANRKCQNLIIEKENSLGLVVGMEYSPFQLLTRIKYLGNFKAAFQFVGMTYMDMSFDYIRIGVKYFKEILKPDRYGTVTPKLVNWTKDEIKQDYGKEMLARVQLYDDFFLEPNNEVYEKTFKGFYNLYQPFVHTPKEFDIVNDLDKIKWSLDFMKHIFGTEVRESKTGAKVNELELGFRYLQILYKHPKMITPILVLTSEERQTGKSTFVDWLNAIFTDNLVVITPGHIVSDFNESYAEKNIVVIEESRFDSPKALEKLKALSTQKSISVNRKHIPTFSLPFYGKLIITSNDESKFSKVDEAEIRYWVRKIPTIKGKENHNILNDLISEIPYFIYYLSQLKEVDFSLSRQGFTVDEINTKALEIVKKESKSALHKEIEMNLQEFCLNETDLETLYFTASDIKRKWFDKNNNFNGPYIAKVLSKEMKLKRTEKPLRYSPSFDERTSKTGLYYTFENKHINKSESDNYFNINEDDTPF